MLGLGRVAGYFSPKYYKSFFRYKSDTASLTGKRIKRSDVLEIKETFESLTPPKISFRRAMEVEGVLDSDLPKSHSMYNYVLTGLLVVSTYPIFLSLKAVVHKMNGGEFFFGFVPALITPLFFILFTFLFYFMYSWFQWRIRNRLLITPYDFIRVVKTFPTEFLPFNDFNDTMSEKHGKDWKKKLPPKKKKVKSQKNKSEEENIHSDSQKDVKKDSE